MPTLKSRIVGIFCLLIFSWHLGAGTFAGEPGRTDPTPASCENRLVAGVSLELARFIAQYLPTVNSWMTIEPVNDDPQHLELTRAMNRALEGGKSLRPLMVILTAQLMGRPIEQVKLIAQSVLILHKASLIADDWPGQDNAQLRNGRPAHHREFGLATSHMTFTSLLGMSQKLLSRIPREYHFDPYLASDVSEYSADRYGYAGMAWGQLKDLMHRPTPPPLEEHQLNTYLKTGIGFEACIYPMAILTAASDSFKRAVKDFAYHLGLVFQIRDDILDVEGDPKKLGKGTGTDKKNGIWTYVSVYGLDSAKEMMASHQLQAKEALKRLGWENTLFADIVRYAAEREY